MSTDDTPKEPVGEPRPEFRLARDEEDRDDRPPIPSGGPMKYLPEMEARRAQPATERQRRFLEVRGKWRDGLTLGEAYDLIEQIKHEERVRALPPVRPRRKPK
jgi:hypothetical protein